NRARRAIQSTRDVIIQDILQAKQDWKSGQLAAADYYKYVAHAKTQLQGTNVAMQQGIGNVNRYGMAIQQLSYGLEDAATQFGTMGLAGAVRGASNNISAAAMAFGP
ncbi:hypothetical protein, partial [Staphylococcus aureus]